MCESKPNTMKLDYVPVRTERNWRWSWPFAFGVIHFLVTVLLVVGGKVIWGLTYQHGQPNIGERMLNLGMSMEYPLKWVDPTNGSPLGWSIVLLNSLLWGLPLGGVVVFVRRKPR